MLTSIPEGIDPSQKLAWARMQRWKARQREAMLSEQPGATSRGRAAIGAGPQEAFEIVSRATDAATAHAEQVTARPSCLTVLL